ncbi:MAG TPA: adenylosuccinate lyase [Spirochaetota bacterium]|nr:adenylosuccinate lyase [Spirochaetota bacterium]HOF13297.1 adenylosuccinate lyase [Spirochaetota bacterium]HOM87879.1 adenylosuccinate lyase [Spirochaetota bacterium]HOR92451.1 adenylosuccinate lyase [Spirochaetota bacterium]HOT19694.1 adenylosuccinate lyase [Spirochaetota bacterium]
MIDRYSRKEISDIWTLENKFKIWLDIEIAACEANAQLGIIPQEDLKSIKEKARFTVARIEEIENQVHHDVIAFLTCVSEYVGPSSRYIHYGLTSSDIVDTALSIQMKQAGEIILNDINQLLAILKKLALNYKQTPCMGRSHGVHAEPTTFGTKMALYYHEFLRNRKRIQDAIDDIAYGKLSGAVGTFSNIDPQVETIVCEKLGLKPDPISTQIIQRDRHAYYMSAIAICAGTLDKLATEIRHLQRTEVREVEEPFQKGQKGSSAMPHKRNPVLCERVSGLSRVIKSNMMVALDNMTLWHERDISHSSAERIILPDSTIALDYLLAKMIFILDNLHVYPDAMMKTIEKTGGLFYSQALLLKLVEKGYTREEAYAIVQDIAMNVWHNGGSLKELSLNDTRINTKLSPEEIEEIFKLDNFLHNIDYIFKKAGLE